MWLSPEFVVVVLLVAPYADLLFVQPFTHIPHQTDNDLIFSIAEKLLQQLRCLTRNMVSFVISERYMQSRKTQNDCKSKKIQKSAEKVRFSETIT
jgi:hypothetical protein